MNKYRLAYSVLIKEAQGLPTELAKGIMGLGKGATKAFFRSGKGLSRAMTEAGVTSPLAHAAAKSMPYAVAAYGGKKAYESEPAQRLRYRIAEYKQRKALEDAQRGGYYG